MHRNGIRRIKDIRTRIYNWGPIHTVSYVKYNSKITGALISRGNRARALQKMNELEGGIKKNHKIEPYKLLFVAYLKISPVLQPRYLKVAGKMQPVAYGLMGEDKRVTFAVKGAVKLLRDKSKTRSIDVSKLAQGLYDATRNQGELFEYKQHGQRALLRNSRKMPAHIHRLRTSRIYHG